MENKNNNKSLFLYTALIFIVAILLIIIAFFGQANVEHNQPELKVTETINPSKQLSSSISERAAVLSDENATLMTENQELKKENESLQKDLENSKKSGEINNTLIEAYSLALNNNKQGSSDILSKIAYDSLNENQKLFYDKIKELCAE